MLVLIVACFTFQVMDKLCAVEAPSSLIEEYLMAIADCYNYKFEPDAKLKVSIDTLLISHTNKVLYLLKYHKGYQFPVLQQYISMQQYITLCQVSVELHQKDYIMVFMTTILVQTILKQFPI